MLVAGLVAGGIMTFAITYPHPSSVGTFTSVSTTTDTVTAITVSTTTTTSVSTITAFPSVNLTTTLAGAYLSHIGAIESQNATALAAQYETNATLQVESNRLNGSYNITRFYAENPCSICLLAYGSFHPASTSVANDTFSVGLTNSGNTGKVTSYLKFYGGASGVCCYPSFTSNAYYFVIGFDMTYVLQGDRWLISTESLTDNGLNYCDAISISPDGNVLTCQSVPS